MRKGFLGVLALVILDWLEPTALAASRNAHSETIGNLSDAIPLPVLERSVGRKFFQSLLRSPIDDWTIVRARVSDNRLSGARVMRASKNPAYHSVALKFANELTLVENPRRAEFALMHLLVYQIADGVMALSFAYPEAAAKPQMKNVGTVRLSVKTKEGPWTEIRPLRESRGRRLQRIDRMPMDVISVRR